MMAAAENRMSAVLFQGVRQPASMPARPTCCVVVDAEEDFDWSRPVRGVDHSTACMRGIVDLNEIVAAYGARPTYLLTYPVIEDPDAVITLRRQHARGECDLGVQLHHWVTPPFPDASDSDNAVEEAKLLVLMARFQERFGFAPVMFRAGRYRLSGATTGLLEKHGFLIDTSIAPRTDFAQQGGPDFSAYDCGPFWFGASRAMLEMPLCRSLIGWCGDAAPCLYRATTGARAGEWRMPAVLSRLRCAERITLSPEGNDAAAMGRFLGHRCARGQQVFSLSFHSSSLMPGRNPYVRSKADLHVFYDRLSAALDMMARRDFEFAALADMPERLGGGRA